MYKNYKDVSYLAFYKECCRHIACPYRDALRQCVCLLASQSDGGRNDKKTEITGSHNSFVCTQHEGENEDANRRKRET